MTAGNIRSRRQFTTVIGVVDLTIRMTTAQFLTFKAFVRDTLSHGAADFDMPISDLTGCTVRRVKLRNGGQYQPSRSGNRIFVSFSDQCRFQSRKPGPRPPPPRPRMRSCSSPLS
jgi:hypothetical protein